MKRQASSTRSMYTKCQQIALWGRRQFFVSSSSLPEKQCKEIDLEMAFFSLFFCQTLTFKENSCMLLCLFYVRAHLSWWYWIKGLWNNLWGLFFFFLVGSCFFKFVKEFWECCRPVLSCGENICWNGPRKEKPVFSTCCSPLSLFILST